MFPKRNRVVPVAVVVAEEEEEEEEENRVCERTESLLCERDDTTGALITATASIRGIEM